MKKHGRKTAGVLCALCTAALLAGCAGTGTGATQGEPSVQASPEADNILFFEAAQNASQEVKGYSAAYLLRGEDRIPLFEADGSKLMVSGSWSPNGSIHQYFTLDGVNFHTFS